MIQVTRYPNKEKWTELTQRPFQDETTALETVLPVIEAVKAEGDAAVSRYAQKFDNFTSDIFELTTEELQKGAEACPADLKKALQVAARNIEAFHTSQKVEPQEVETMEGVSCWRRTEPIRRVGFYIPSGTAPLFSTLLMLGVPSKIAGCEERILCTPPWKDGKVHPAILYTATLVEIERIFVIGGAQAIAAMAYGTETVPKVDKIFGPGNRYVTAAKQVVAQDAVAIDMPAGPSEVAVVADESGFADFIAADLLSQAEHGTDSHVLFVTTSERLLEDVLNELDAQCERLPRKAIARSSLEKSCAVVVEDVTTALELVNQYAPEHLILSVQNPREVAKQVRSAGSVFLGHYTPEALGDYASGTNHVLPTNGWARCYSGVSLSSFQKAITFQEVTPKGLKALGHVVETLAHYEELQAHKEAVSVRLKKLPHQV
jgi:histidinol dehydrogenase